MPPKKQDRLPQQEGEASHRTCNVCGKLKPITEFYPRRTAPKSLRKKGERRGMMAQGVDGGRISLRFPNCIRCDNDAAVKRQRVKWLSALDLDGLREEERRTILMLQTIQEVMMSKLVDNKPQDGV